MIDRAVFLDKDGTLVENVPYNVEPDLVRLAPGVADGLRALHDAGYRLIVITNQSGVARGYFPEAALAAVNRCLNTLLADQGVFLSGFYYCPHHPDGVVPGYNRVCNCRKPKPGLILHAARDLGIDLSQSWFVGDILNDVEAGRRAGCRTILIDNGGETEWDLVPWRRPHYTAPDFSHVPAIITTANDQPTNKPTNKPIAGRRACTERRS